MPSSIDLSKLLSLVKALLIAAWAGLVPIHNAILTAMALTMADLLLALAAAHKAGRPITSAGMKRTVAKIAVYEVAIILAFASETYLLGNVVPATRMITGLIGMTELKSCLEHLDDLGGNQLFASLLSKLAPPKLPSDDDNNEV